MDSIGHRQKQNLDPVLIVVTSKQGLPKLARLAQIYPPPSFSHHQAIARTIRIGSKFCFCRCPITQSVPDQIQLSGKGSRSGQDPKKVECDPDLELLRSVPDHVCVSVQHLGNETKTYLPPGQKTYFCPCSPMEGME